MTKHPIYTIASELCKDGLSVGLHKDLFTRALKQLIMAFLGRVPLS